MKGIKRVCSDTKTLRGFYSPEYLQLFYDAKTDELFTEFLFSIGHNSFIQSDDPEIINLGFLYEPMTMQEVKEYVDREMMRIKLFRDGA